MQVVDLGFGKVHRSVLGGLLCHFSGPKEDLANAVVGGEDGARENVEWAFEARRSMWRSCRSGWQQWRAREVRLKDLELLGRHIE